MATKHMLIDASHPEETRVVVVDGTRLEEYDVESAARRQLKGNIYLAKLTRVEPSLQAAFVDYGGNRHGFLAFNEIHADYYQIPVADREALLAEQAAAERAAESQEDDSEVTEAAVADEDDDVERRRIRPSSRNYKIQEVIKRRQIMLVQVAKEERGSKGAALTTYLSLAGRYCVLMPNTARGGGISRKITTVTDRKRLKKILAELEVPEGMAVIVRTAGAGRSKAEIKRDYEYLIRLWSNIRELTLQSTAPALVYEEGNLIKRSIRDLYGRDIEEIIIHGEPEYKIAKEFMKLFIPSHAKRVKLYEDDEKPFFQGFQVEDQLDAMHQPVMQLKSGGYIVINPTEALVSIDVNSGRATRERHIEETALRTNLEAADEIARQLRLRDLAGLVVIDFIDMEVQRNQAMVERRLKEAMKNDRARVQIGRISPFGLLELSRQRLRPSLLETSFEVCPHCAGTGMRRTVESMALAMLRKIEEEGLKRRAVEINLTTAPPAVAYLLNQKRRSLSEIERRYQLSVSVSADPEYMGADYRIDRVKLPSLKPEEEAVEAEEVIETESGAEVSAEATEREDAAKRSRRRRPRRRRRVEDETRAATEAAEGAEVPGEEPALDVDGEAESEDESITVDAAADSVTDDDQSDAAKRRRRRGKRGGRRRGRRSVGEGGEAAESPPVSASDLEEAQEADGSEEAAETIEEIEVAIDVAAPAMTEAVAICPEPAGEIVETASQPALVVEEASEAAGEQLAEESDRSSERSDPADAPPDEFGREHEFADVRFKRDSVPPSEAAGSADNEVPATPASVIIVDGGQSEVSGEEARRTETRQVDHDDDDEDDHDSPRRGWWQKMLP